MIKIIYALLPNVLAIFMQLGATMLMTHHLTSDKFGQWTYLFGYFSLAGSFILLGSNRLVLREFSGSVDEEERVKIMTHALSIVLVMSLLIVPISYYHFIHLPQIEISNPVKIIVLITFSAFAYSLTVIVSAFLLARKAQVKSSTYMYLPRPLALLGAGVFSLIFSDLVDIWMVFALSFLTILSIAHKDIKEILLWAKKVINIRLSYLKEGLVIMLIYGHIQINAYLDGYFLIEMMDAKSVGFYRIGFMLAGIVLMLSGNIMRQSTPYIGDFLMKRISIGELNTKLNKHNLLSVLISLGAVIGTVVLGNLVLINFYGPEYSESLYPLLIILLGYFVKFLFGPADIALNLAYKDNILLYITLTGILLNVLLNYLLINPYGIEGCAWSTAIVTLLMSISNSFYSYRKTGINTTIFKNYLKSKDH